MTTLPPRQEWVWPPTNREATLQTKRESSSGLSRETGAGKESRTPDLNLGKVALYQLSYSRGGVQL